MSSAIGKGSQKTISTEVSEGVREEFRAWAIAHGFNSIRDALRALILAKLAEEKAGPAEGRG